MNEFQLRQFLFAWMALSLFTFHARSQTPTKIELQHADIADYDESVSNEIQRLIGNVSFRHKNAVMYCDSAYLNKIKNSMEAFSHVRISQGDTVSLTGKRLVYDGNTQLAQVFDDVVMTDRKMT